MKLKLSETEPFITLSVDVELNSLSIEVTTEVLLFVEAEALSLPLKLSDVERLSLELKEVEMDSLILIDIDCELLSDTD